MGNRTEPRCIFLGKTKFDERREDKMNHNIIEMPDLKAVFGREPTRVEQAYWRYAIKRRNWILATIGETVWGWILKLERKATRGNLAA